MMYDEPENAMAAEVPIDRQLVEELSRRMKESSAAAAHHRQVADMHQRVVNLCQGALEQQEKPKSTIDFDSQVAR